MKLRWLFVALVLIGCDSEPPPESSLPLRAILGGQADEGFQQAIAVREFSFPRDHGPHPGFRNEWWYLTGNLTDKSGAAYGYQLTFFRTALAPQKPQRQSSWATHQLWMAHLALTDIDGGRHYRDERFSRGAPGLAGARLSPFKVWLDDWQLSSPDNGFPWQLTADTGNFALQLQLQPLRAPVLQGDRGLSQKSLRIGNASYYYSITRLTSQGTLSLNGKEYQVSGLSWLDREWSTSALDNNQNGWDWFSLQLDSGEDLMYYRLRDLSDQTHPNSAGNWINRDGIPQMLTAADIRTTPLHWWRSDTGERYPVRWQLECLPCQQTWLVEALLEDQHMDLSIKYWEGAVVIKSAASGQPLGRGYLEMTGYDQPTDSTATK